MITIGDAIHAINSDAVYEHESTIDSIIWRENTNPIELSVIQAKIAELTAAEPLRILRHERNRLITATDWWVLSDRTPTQAQLDYRQALRDLPANSPNAALDEQGNLINVTWPEMPQ